MQIKITGKGFGEIEKLFRELPVELQRDAYLRGGMRVARRVVELAKKTAPVGSRLRYGGRKYRDEFAVVRGDKGRKGQSRISISRAGSINARAVNYAPHAWLIEHGSNPRRTRDGMSRGRMPAFHTMERAADVARSTAGPLYGREIELAVKRIVKQITTGKFTRSTRRAFRSPY